MISSGETLSYFIFIVILLWLPQAFRQLLLWTYWIQVKEYRLDRFASLIKSSSGRKSLGFVSTFGKIILLLGLILFTNKQMWRFGNQLLVITVIYFVILDFRLIGDGVFKKLRKPTLTLRAFEILIITLAGTLIILGSVLARTTLYSSLLFSEVLLLILPFVAVVATSVLVRRTKLVAIDLAQRKIKKINPKVIGITGSYGKTTTKEFIYRLLSSKYKVSKTPGSHNTEFGLARAVINNLGARDKYFVAEYGAYKKGEIKKLTKIAKPEIAVIIAIEPQHLELFGSLGNIKKAKYELVNALEKGDTAIFNIGNSGVNELYKKAKKQRSDLTILSYKFSNLGKTLKNTDISAYVVQETKKGITFIVNYMGEKHKLSTNLPASFFVENLLPAILIANKENISWGYIRKSLKNLSLPAKTINIIKKKTGVVIIDDSHNSTPTGFEAALNALSKYKSRKKIVITPGIIELGELSKSIHSQIAKKMKENKIDLLILTKQDEYKIFKENLGKKTIMFKNKSQVLEVLKDPSENVILIEGRVPVVIKNTLNI